MPEEISKDEFYMREALKLAARAYQEDEIPIGAVIVGERVIIAKGYNQTEKLNDVTAHAEMLAITAAENYIGGKYLTGCTLYVTIEPCPMCAAALHWAQIDRIVFGAKDIKKGYSLFSPSLVHPKTEVIAGVLEKECAELMQRFFREKRQGL